jgi:RHS repeat-associated protein
LVRGVRYSGATPHRERVVSRRQVCLSLLVGCLVLVLASLGAASAAAQRDCITGCGPPAYQVSVRLEEANPLTRVAYTSPTDTFWVTNSGANIDEYFPSCVPFGGTISCVSVNPSDVLLSAGQSVKVAVTYNVGPAGGGLRLTVNGESNTASATYTVNATPPPPSPPSVTIVAPVLTSGARAVLRNRQPVVRVMIMPIGSAIDTTHTEFKWRGENVLGLARANHGLIEWDVDSTRWLNVGDSAQIQVTACSQNGLCDTASVWAVLPNDQRPVLGFTGVPLEALGRQFQAPFGPGLAVSGAEIETGVGTTPYFTMGAARSAGLVYSTRQSYPRALVPVDVELPWPAGTPDKLHVVLFDGAVKLDSLVVTSPTCATGAVRRCRAVLQGDFSSSSFSTPTRKWLTVQVQVDSGATTKMSADSVEVVLVDRRATGYGSGWWPAGVVTLVKAGADRLLVDANGTAEIYRGNGDSLYLPPPGTFTVLKKNPYPYGWTLQPWGSTAQIVFDWLGRVAKRVDQNGQRDTVRYADTSYVVSALIDPVGAWTTFAYNGFTLASITDPYGRQTRVTIDAGTNQLVFDSTSSPNAPRYGYQGYPGTSTAVLTQVIGVIGDTTTVTYDSTFFRRPCQVTLPRVQDENGTPVTPVIAYRAVERQGYGSLVSLDSVYVGMTDPRGNWTRSLLNRWGQARKTWDGLGVLSRASYTGEGFVQWAEGKVPDSSRVYTTYGSDPQRLPSRSYIVRAAGDTMLVDSLVYDANRRVIRRYDARRQMTQLAYDSNGNVILTITPNGDTTQYYLRSDGLLDSLRMPKDTAASAVLYEASTKQQVRVTDPSGALVDTAEIGSAGRVVSRARKVRVQASGGPTYAWQWQRTDLFYNGANQIDSSVTYRSDNCSDPCNTMPSFPTDSAHVHRVSHRFDRAGRDSLRLDDRGTATLMLYDLLGRVTSTRPWTDSMAVVDTFMYDVAGNLKRHVTRRGDTLTTNYDSRNRDTLTTIPGVGTLRKAYGGPLDQLTRVWYDNPADSIGGVNGELRYGYDQHGRLKADTSFAGTVAEATSYAYDTFERPTTITDPLGAWSTRYETNRGIADTVLTPMGDTVTYAFDAKARATGPTIRGGGPQESQTPAWTAGGALQTLTASVVTSPTFSPLSYTRSPATSDAQAALTPVWTTQYGAGATTDSLKDSVTYDGWGRVSRWVALKNSTLVDSASFSFDRTGNIITQMNGSQVYDSVTNRLVSQAGSTCTTINYTYDRAGNLTDLVCGSTHDTYVYDALNRLRTVANNGTIYARYSYDVLGRRIVKRVYGLFGTVAYTRFVCHGDAVAFETDSSGASIGLRYTWGQGTDDLVAVEDASGNHYYAVRDKLGSVRGLVRRDGTWMMSQRFGPYGNVIARDTSATVALGFKLRYGWTGREYDNETGFYYFRARYYFQIMRRFIQEDPIGNAGGGNLYAYAGGGPLEARDPSGMVMYAGIEAHGGGGGGSGLAVYVDGAPAGGLIGSLFVEGFFDNAVERADYYPNGLYTNDYIRATPFERHNTGKLNFPSLDEKNAFLSLQRRALEANDEIMLEELRRAEDSYYTITFFASGCIASACTFTRFYRIEIDAPLLPIPAEVALAHELGHAFLAPFGVPPVRVPNSPMESWPSEYSAFYYEERARLLFGCRPRPWDYHVSPC